MVPAENLLASRTVEDVVIYRENEPPDVRGTKVGDQVLSTDKDTLFPLQGALGYEIAQSLFVGKDTLIVEGPSDILYLKSVSEELRAQNKVHLDPRWTLCPAGGIDKVPAFISLFGGNKLHIAVLTDLAHGQKRRIEDLRRSDLLREGHVFTADTYAGQNEADVEDLLGADIYASLVNACYDLKGERAVKVPPGGGRVVKHVEEHFRGLPADVPEFDHFAPSSYLMEHRSTFFKTVKKSLPAALQRFENLFSELNALLG